MDTIDLFSLVPALVFLFLGLYLYVRKPLRWGWSYPWIVSGSLSLAVFVLIFMLYPLYATKPETAVPTGKFLNDLLSGIGQAAGYEIGRHLDSVIYGVIALVLGWIVTWFFVRKYTRSA